MRKPVSKPANTVFKDQLLDRLGLRGTVTFDYDTNPGIVDGSLSEPLERAQAVQLLTYRTSDGAKIPATAIGYKVPHKLSQDEIVTGLASEIQLERDVISKDGDGFAFAAKALAATAITELFSYMVIKGIQYNYVCTGQAFVFLHIPDDPAIVYYYVCVPTLDVLDDDENKLHRTAVAQVFAFILQALRAAPPSLSWHDAAAGLDIWAVEYDDVLSRIPPSVRKDKECRAFPYKPSVGVALNARRSESVHLAGCSSPNLLLKTVTMMITVTMTMRMPLLRRLWAGRLGPDADSAPLYLSGSVGSLFKVRLSAYGYTLVAKGVETTKLPRLRHENDIYDRIFKIQGRLVPICLRLIDLVLPYYYDGSAFEHFLLLSWAGRPLSMCVDEVNKTLVVDLATKAYTELHQLEILHGDAEPRNILCDVISGNLMIADFERAQFCGHQPLGSNSPDTEPQQKKRRMQKKGKDDLARELQSVVLSISRCFSNKSNRL